MMGFCIIKNFQPEVGLSHLMTAGLHVANTTASVCMLWTLWISSHSSPPEVTPRTPRSYGALPIHLFTHFCCRMYRIATMHSVTDRRTDGQTDNTPRDTNVFIVLYYLVNSRS